MFERLAAFVISLILFLGGLSSHPAGAEDVPIGTNLRGIMDWSTELPFVDVFKSGRPLFSGSYTQWEDERRLNVDESGWVTYLEADQVARTVMCWDIGGHYPSGRYVVLYDGEGTMEWSDNARPIESSPGRIVLDVDNPAFQAENRGRGIALAITSVNPANHLRNIRVRMPSSAADDEVFNPTFVDRLRGYRVLRFNQWLLGEESLWYEQTSWESRPRMTDAQWSTNGPPLELMIELCNRLHADAWFCIPTHADEGFVRGLAALVNGSLDPTLHVYVEWSNEVFNDIFPEADFARTEGLRLELSSDPITAQMLYYARHSREVFQWIEGMIPASRLTRVLTSWCEFPDRTERIFQDSEALAHTDALAIAPYWGMIDPDEEGAIEPMSVTQFMEYLRTTALPTVLGQVAAHKALAQAQGLPLIAYEGGLDLRAAGEYAGSQALNTLFDTTARDPRMGDRYDEFLLGWQSAGGGLMVHFNDCDGHGPNGGRWGALEYITQPRSEAPKYDALMRWMESHGQIGSATPAQIVVALGQGGNDSIATFDNASRGFASLPWMRVPWASYAYANGETRVAAGDVDGDGRDELVVSFGSYPQEGGWACVLDDAQAGSRVLAWIRIPDPAYNAANGETWPACGDVDGDGRAEILLGTGAAPGRAGYVQVFDDQRGGFAALARVSCRRAAYIAASGEVHPACGDVDGDGRAEIVLGFGTYRADGGNVDVLDDAGHGYALLRSFKVRWSAYNAACGAVWPACGDFDGNGSCGIVLGLGRGSSAWMELFRGASGQYAHCSWLQVPWYAYAAANGETRPCCGSLDGDRAAELVVGLGRYPSLGGYMPVFDDASTGFAVMRWIRVPAGAYDATNGETRPAMARMR